MKKDALDFLKAVKQDPMAMKTFEEISKSYLNQNMAAILSDVAKKLNYDISSEDISEALKQEDEAVKSATDKNVESIIEVDDDELSEVAGGEDLYTRSCTTRHLRLESEGCIDKATFWNICYSADNCYFFAIVYYYTYDD
jgi:putative sterol carrier protein